MILVAAASVGGGLGVLLFFHPKLLAWLDSPPAADTVSLNHFFQVGGNAGQLWGPLTGGANYWRAGQEQCHLVHTGRTGRNRCACTTAGRW